MGDRIEKKSRSQRRGAFRVINQCPARLAVDDLFLLKGSLLQKAVNKNYCYKTKTCYILYDNLKGTI